MSNRFAYLLCLPTLALCAQAQRPILETKYQNPPLKAKTMKWAAEVCSGQKYFVNDQPANEWTQVLDPASETDDRVVGVSGVASLPKVAQNDVPFTHPFGLDWEFWLAPDPAYAGLLAAGNFGPDSEFVAAIKHATSLGVVSPKGTLGVETDQDLVPAAYRAKDGDRVVLFGRLIADCGHEDFHTEIHPPLLLASARATDAATTVTVIARPWLVGQRFEVDGETIRQHLLNEVIKVETLRSRRVEAHPKILPPFSRVQHLSYTVRPPGARPHGAKVRVAYHFTVRHGVHVEVARKRDGAEVRITLDPATYKVAPLPRRKEWNVPLSLIGRETDVINKLQMANMVGHPVAGLFLSRDWITDRYDAPVVANPQMDDNTVSQTVDDTQAFPVYGWMRVWWTGGADESAIPQ